MTQPDAGSARWSALMYIANHSLRRSCRSARVPLSESMKGSPRQVTKFVFREMGKPGGVPVVLLHHLTAVLEDWDPRVVDGLAAKHHVIVFDNRGVGGSGGSTPKRSRRWLGTPSHS